MERSDSFEHRTAKPASQASPHPICEFSLPPWKGEAFYTEKALASRVFSPMKRAAKAALFT
jgi:hypothetical protein